MNIARILFPVNVLGPGDRIGIWVCGCKRGCYNCSNPELWEQKKEYEISITDLKTLISSIDADYNVEGFTISGGEPFEQCEELETLVNYLLEITPDILIYTGFTIDELKKQNNKSIENVLKTAGVIIDGAYVDEKNDNTYLRGSSNQNIYILNGNLKYKYENHISNGENMIQNFSTRDGVVSVGIHAKGFQNEFEKLIKRKEIEVK